MREWLATRIRRIVAKWTASARPRPRTSQRLHPALGRTLCCEPLEARRLLTATLTLSGTTLQYHYSAASIAPSIAGTDGTLGLTVSTGGGEALSVGTGIVSSPITNGAKVSIPAGVTTIEISSDNGSVAFFSVGDLNIAEGLHIDNSLPIANFNGTIQAASVEADGQVQIYGTSVTTTGAQTYIGFIGLNNNVHLIGTSLTSSTGVGSDGYDFHLTFSNPVTVENFSGINNFTSDGTGGTIITGDFSTALAQTYSNAVTVEADAVLASTGNSEGGQSGGNITFNSTVDSASAKSTANLTVDTTATITTGLVGSLFPLQTLTTNGGETLVSGDVTTIAGQSYNDPVVQTANAHVTGATLTTGASWNAANFDLHLTFVSGISVPGIFTNVHNFTSDGTGGTTITADFATTGSQTYGNSVRQSPTVLLSGTTFAATGATWNAGGNSLQLSFTGNVTLATAFSNLNVFTIGSGGSIQQTAGSITATSVAATSKSGTLLNAGNTINSFSAANSAGDLQLNDGAAPLTITSITEAGGNVQVINYGGLRIGGAITDTASQGIVSLLERKTDIQEQGKGAISANMLIVQSKSGVTLGGANAVSNFLGWNDPGPGNLLLNNTIALTVQTVIESGGSNLTVDNAGGIRITGTLKDTGGTVTLADTTGGIQEVAGMIIAAQLSTNSAAGTNLNGANFVGQFTAADNSSQGIQFNNSGALQIGAVTESGGGSVQIINYGVGTVGHGMVLAGNISAPAGIVSLKEWNGDIQQAATFSINANTLVSQSKQGTSLAGAGNAFGGLVAMNDGGGNITLVNLPNLYVAAIGNLLDPSQTGGNVVLDEGGGLYLPGTGTITAVGSIVLNVGQSGASSTTLAGAIQSSAQVTVNSASSADSLTVDLATAAFPAAGLYFNGGAAQGISSFTVRAKPLATASASSTVNDFFVVHENSNTPANPGVVQSSLSSPSAVVFRFADISNLSIVGNQNTANEQDYGNEYVGFYVGTGVNPLAKFTYNGGSGFNRMAVTGTQGSDVIGVGDTNDPIITSVAIPSATTNPVPLRFYVNSNDLAVLQLVGKGGGDTLVNASATAHALLDGTGGNNILWGGNGGLSSTTGQISPAGVDILLGEPGGANQLFGDSATNYLLSNYVWNGHTITAALGTLGQKPNYLIGLNGTSYLFPSQGDAVADSTNLPATFNSLAGIKLSGSVYPSAGTTFSSNPGPTLATIRQDPALQSFQPPF